MTSIPTPPPRLRATAYHAQRAAAGLATPATFDTPAPRLSSAARFLLTWLTIAALLLLAGGLFR